MKRVCLEERGNKFKKTKKKERQRTKNLNRMTTMQKKVQARVVMMSMVKKKLMVGMGLID